MVSFVLAPAALVAVTLLLGVHLSGLAALNPVLHAMSSKHFIPVKRAPDMSAPKTARPLLPSSLAVTAAAAFSASTTGRAAVGAASSMAPAALIVALLAILRGGLPINRSMANWLSEAPPSDWPTTHARWERIFGVRRAANAIAPVAILAAVAASDTRLGQ